jgi:Na+/glutamate symporter
MLLIFAVAAIGALVGVLAGVSLAHWLLTRHRPSEAIPSEPADPFVSAEIDRAAVEWASANGQPEQAASVMADKLHLLYALARKRSWRSS